MHCLYNQSYCPVGGPRYILAWTKTTHLLSILDGTVIISIMKQTANIALQGLVAHEFKEIVSSAYDQYR